jgi:hypothetical protein
MFTVVDRSRCYDRIEEFGERDELGRPRYASGKKADRSSVVGARFTDNGRPVHRRR